MKEKLQEYIKNNLETEVYIGFKKARYDVEQACCLQNARLYDDDENINDYIKNNIEESKFQKVLFNYIDKRHLKDSDV